MIPRLHVASFFELENTVEQAVLLLEADNLQRHRGGAHRRAITQGRASTRMQ